MGNLTTLTDEEGKETTYGYDKENRLVSMEIGNESEKETTERTYDGRGRLTSITFPKGNKREFGYDAFGRLTSVTDDPDDQNPVCRCHQVFGQLLPGND